MIGTLFFQYGDDMIERLAVQERLAGLSVVQNGNRNTPASLSRDAPFGSAVDERFQASFRCERCIIRLTANACQDHRTYIEVA